MVKRNKNLAKLQAGYLFPEINKRKKQVVQANPNAKIISLGIGNTTEPLTKHIIRSLTEAVQKMGTKEGYSGYGDEQGLTDLREKIAKVFYKNEVKANEVFVSDGAKCDIGRLQLMFGNNVSVSVQDPSYPVYVDGSVIVGATGEYNTDAGQFKQITYLPCTPENEFFPDFEAYPRTDLIYFCSPNNPTGAVATRDQLKKLVQFAKKNGSIIVFDAAYSEFIQDSDLPKTIFEIDGAKEVAIEVNSLSKPVGFTGVRLGWTVVPEELCFADGEPVIKDWNRIMTTVFNGASNIVQYGALSVLDPEGYDEMKDLINHYMENAKIINDVLKNIGITTYGGDNAPYIWAEFKGWRSWDMFEKILNEAFIVTTPGSGFGPAGEGFIRFSAFGSRENVLEAVSRLKNFSY